MSIGRPRSLKWSLVLRIAVLQCAMLTLIIVAILGTMLATGLIPHDYEDGTMDVLADAVARDASGKLVLNETPDMTTLRSNVADLWFIIRDKQGQRLQEGTVPATFQPFVGLLDNISDARIDHALGQAAPPAGKIRWTDTAAGTVQIMTGTKGGLSLLRLLGQAPQFFLQGILPLAGLMALGHAVRDPLGCARRTLWPWPCSRRGRAHRHRPARRAAAAEGRAEGGDAAGEGGECGTCTPRQGL